MGLFKFYKNKKRNKKELDWVSRVPKQVADPFLQEIRDNPQACSGGEILQGIGDFGFNMSNPIPMYGIPSNETFLNR